MGACERYYRFQESVSEVLDVEGATFVNCGFGVQLLGVLIPVSLMMTVPVSFPFTLVIIYRKQSKGQCNQYNSPPYLNRSSHSMTSALDIVVSPPNGLLSMPSLHPLPSFLLLLYYFSLAVATPSFCFLPP